MALAGALVAAGLADVGAGLGSEVAGKAVSSAKIPVMKEVRSVDKSAVSVVPSLALLDTVILGAR